MIKSRLPDLIKAGEEEKHIKTQLLLPVTLFTFLFVLISVILTLLAREFAIMAGLIVSAIMLFIGFERLRNNTYLPPAVLFMIQGYGLLTASLLFEGSSLLPTILFVVFYFLIAGIIFSPKTSVWLFVYSILLIVFMWTEIIPPVFPAPNLPDWYTSWFSLVFILGLLGLFGVLAYRALAQGLEIARSTNQVRDQIENDVIKFRSIVEQSPLPTFITDLDGSIEYVNAQFCKLTGYAADELLGKNPRMFKTEFTPVEFYDYLWAAIRAGEQWVGELVNRRKDGSIVYIGARISSLLDADGKPAHFLAFEEDITRRKLLENEVEQANQQMQALKDELARLNDQLQEQSRLDHLTGLYTRSYLMEILPREILRAARARNSLILMLIDVDHFSAINDRYGRSAGDDLLQAIANVIKQSLGRYDLAFRYANDAFLLLIPGDPKDSGLTRADGVRQAIGNQPIQWKDQTIDLTVSIGLAVYPLHAEQEDDLLTRAEKALEISRKSGGNRVTLWSENL